jgi:hypothetical protein
LELDDESETHDGVQPPTPKDWLGIAFSIAALAFFILILLVKASGFADLEFVAPVALVIVLGSAGVVWWTISTLYRKCTIKEVLLLTAAWGVTFSVWMLLIQFAYWIVEYAG